MEQLERKFQLQNYVQCDTLILRVDSVLLFHDRVEVLRTSSLFFYRLVSRSNVLYLRYYQREGSIISIMFRVLRWLVLQIRLIFCTAFLHCHLIRFCILCISFLPLLIDFQCYAIPIGCNALVAYSYLLYKFIVTFMSCLAVVIMLHLILLSLH